MSTLNEKIKLLEKYIQMAKKSNKDMGTSRFKKDIEMLQEIINDLMYG